MYCLARVTAGIGTCVTKREAIRCLTCALTGRYTFQVLPPKSSGPEAPARQSGPTLGVVLVASLATSLLALLFFSWLARQVFEGELSRFDVQVRLAIHQYANPSLTLAMEAISDLGSPVFLTCLFAVLVIVFLLRRWRYAALWLSLSMAGALALDVTLKRLFHRPRPVAFFVPQPPTYSFPSGHALGSFCFYMVLAGLVTARLRDLRARVVIWLLAALLVAAVGFSRVYLGVHWPTDVVAGYAAAACWVGGLVAVDRWRRR